MFHLQDPMRAVRIACMEEPSLEFLAFALQTTMDHSASTPMDITPVRPAVVTYLHICATVACSEQEGKMQ